jgi:transcriptional regulator with XRE-family HTH domain
MEPDFWGAVNTTIKSNRVKQEWLAEKTGIKYQTLRSWISKNILPRADDAVKIAKELGVTVEYLIEGHHSTMPQEIDSFYLKYKKFSILLAYLEQLTQEQREDIEAFALMLVDKNHAREIHRL